MSTNDASLTQVFAAAQRLERERERELAERWGCKPCPQVRVYDKHGLGPEDFPELYPGDVGYRGSIPL